MRLIEHGLATATLDMTREDLVTAKNAIYEAYVELGEWEFTKRIGRRPDDALALLKGINRLLRQTLT